MAVLQSIGAAGLSATSTAAAAAAAGGVFATAAGYLTGKRVSEKGVQTGSGHDSDAADSDNDEAESDTNEAGSDNDKGNPINGQNAQISQEMAM